MIAPAFLAGALALAPGDCSDGPGAIAIMDQRATFNAAIRNADVAAIAPILAADVVLVAGTHSDRFNGRAEQLRVWQDDFDDPDRRLIYVRTPACIVPSDVTDMAMEYGQWRGEGKTGESASGRYVAKWRLIDGAWRIEVEVFMTEHCEGAICPAKTE